ALEAMHLGCDVRKAAIDDIVHDLRIELLGEGGEAGHVGKQDGDLLALTLKSRPGRQNFLGQVFWRIGEWRMILDTDWRYSWRWRRCWVLTPDQHGAVLIDGELAGLDDFCLQILQVRIIKTKLPLESPICDSLMALEEL